jgi:hypothetical protein
MKSEQQHSDVQGEVVDGDEVPPQYRLEGLAGTQSGNGRARDEAQSKQAPQPRRNLSRQGTILAQEIKQDS